eukprot:TRINITY_DN37216_c0_g1_i1.p3 TRINITY_DN37216_c0_g1~~TRINITY_DN37216_c0_g1_i1.p3  ORF type:complete len:144 (-),score=20.32 TRINITY_DN37216_c0_g1_i1:206-637(-)
MLIYFSNTLIPDEHYFITTACNSREINSTIRPAMLHYTNWDNINWGERDKIGNFGPNTITKNLLKKALKSGAFFVRKIGNDSESLEIMKLLDLFLSEGQVEIDGELFTKEEFVEISLQQLNDAMNGKTCQQKIDEDKHQPCKI